MKFGTLQGVIAEPLDSVFEVARSLGFDGVELDWFNAEDAKIGSLARPERARIRQSASEAGIEIPSVAAHFLNGGGIACPDENLQQAGLDAIKTGIELCHDLGATVLLIPFFGPAEIVDIEGRKHLIENLKVLAPLAESADVKLGVEGALRGDVMARLFDEVASPSVGSYWDMANCMSIGYDALEEVQSLRSHIVQVHAKEFKGEMRTQVREYPNLNPVPLGQGQVPIRDVLQQLQRYDYDGYIVLETGHFGDTKQSAAEALRVLKATWAKIQ